MSRLRELAEPFVVATPAGTSTTDRLRVTPDEAAMLAEVGGFLGGLFRTDFARRAAEGRLGSKETAVSRRDRKRALTGVSSSRWAGACDTRSHTCKWNRQEDDEGVITVFPGQCSGPVPCPGVRRG